MNRPILIIALVIALIASGGYYIIHHNPKVEAWGKEVGLIKAPEVETPPSYNAVFIIFDPSGSGNSTYSVPRITCSFISQVIDKIQEAGSGEIWLTFIDMNASNNLVLHLTIPAEVKDLTAPTRTTGERKADFDKRIVEFKRDSLDRLQKNAGMRNKFESEKKQFIADCQSMIDKGYAPKLKGTDYSDVIGSLNTGLRSLATIPYDTIHFRSLVMISDGVQSYRFDTPKEPLNQIPTDITVVTVNHSGSKNNVLQGRNIELDNLDRVLNIAVTIFKPSNL